MLYEHSMLAVSSAWVVLQRDGESRLYHCAQTLPGRTGQVCACSRWSALLIWMT